MKKLLILLLGAILIGILSYFCFLDKAGGIKDDLLTKAQSAYTNKQMDWVDTSIKGDELEITRILILDGTAPTQKLKDEAEDIALALEGVDGVDNRLKVTASIPPTVTVAKAPIVVEPTVSKPDVVVPTLYIISAKKDQNRKITLSGYVPDEQVHEKLVARANMLFGKTNVTDELKEIKGAPDRWFKSAKLGVDGLSAVDYGEFEIVDMDFNFKGYVGNVEEKVLLLQNFENRLHSSYEGNYTIEAPEPIVEVKKPQFVCQEEFQKILSNEKIHFKYNSADVKPSSYKLLDALIVTAQKCPDDTIFIEGHTDSDGMKSYNLKLSTSRANAVKEYLVSKGIPENRLNAVGYGESKPIATNKTAEGKAQNRRIEFNVKGVK